MPRVISGLKKICNNVTWPVSSCQKNHTQKNVVLTYYFHKFHIATGKVKPSVVSVSSDGILKSKVFLKHPFKVTQYDFMHLEAKSL